jgi:uncharacterized membrane protein
VLSVSLLLLLTLATVFGFVAYLHGVVRLMRVQYLLETIANEARQAIDHNFPPLSAYVEAAQPADHPHPRELSYDGRSGVIMATDLFGLVELCREHDCWLELTVGVGEYLHVGSPFAVVHGTGPDGPEVARFLLIGGERSFVQDPAFGFRQLVDTAIRAVSPAVNDPTTAVQAIDRINDLLVIAGSNPDPTGLRVGETGKVRVKRQLRGFEALLVLALTEIIRYGADAPQVIRRLRALLDDLDHALPPERHAAIAHQRKLLESAVTATMPAPFQPISSTPDREGFG